MIQTALFAVGDQVRMRDSQSLLIIREVKVRSERAMYRIADVWTLVEDIGSSWWVTQEELQPSKDR